MFREWGFLLGEIWVLLLLAALLGLLVGWIIWGRRSSGDVSGDVNRLKADLDACGKRGAEKDARIKSLEADLAACKASKSAPVAAVAGAPVAVDAGQDFDGDGVVEGKNEGTKPATLTAPRGGKADDLKLIKGVGPKMEKLCNKLGFYHFDQVASWNASEVAWVDANLEGFKGRVSRDNWVDQAKTLADGGETEFSKRQ